MKIRYVHLLLILFPSFLFSATLEQKLAKEADDIVNHFYNGSNTSVMEITVD